MFVLKEDGGLVKMKQEEFSKEEDFQKLLGEYPALLAGELINPEEPRRWLLVTREIPVPSEMGGGGVWAADHLFLDQEGIPTIVEVKRQSDTRGRREVVAQMLDYAAHGAVYWNVDVLRAAFEQTCRDRGEDPENKLTQFLGEEGDVDKFWDHVKTNLEAQRLRLLFVADSISRELKRIVEFLNSQMNPTEVLALELKHYVGDNQLRTLAPTLFGQTEKASSNKQSGPARNWDESSLFQAMSIRWPATAVDAGKAILRWMEKNSDRVVFGHGKVDGSVTSYIFCNGLKLYPMTLSTQGKVWINFHDCMKPPFDSEAKRREWQAHLNELDGIKVSDDKLTKYPIIPLALLDSDEKRKKFLAVMDWFANELKPFRKSHNFSLAPAGRELLAAK